jgi:SAM-dependent methyltransferase
MIIQTAARGKYQGVTQIIRFNWPFYVTALVLVAAGGTLLTVLPLPNFTRAVCLIGLTGAAFWLTASVMVSHYIYDRSALYDSAWIRRALPVSPAHWANFHAGFDEFGPLLTAAFGRGTIIDFFDPDEMTEPSIERARHAAQPSPESIHAKAGSLPLRDSELDAAFVFFSAHELRQAASRVQFLTELHRVLNPVGRIILLEHLRDLPNFLAFGPGFLHFHSRQLWINAIEAARFRVQNEFHWTPFVRAFVLEKKLPAV